MTKTIDCYDSWKTKKMFIYLSFKVIETSDYDWHNYFFFSVRRWEIVSSALVNSVVNWQIERKNRRFFSNRQKNISVLYRFNRLFEYSIIMMISRQLRSLIMSTKHRHNYNPISEDGHDTKIPLYSEESFEHGISFHVKVNRPNRRFSSLIEKNF